MSRRPYRGQFLLIALITAITRYVGWLGLAFLEQRVIATTGEVIAVVAAAMASERTPLPPTHKPTSPQRRDLFQAAPPYRFGWQGASS
jgi:hypothetical protein